MWVLPEHKRYKSLGLCIYCNVPARILTDEHIIAKALKGRLIFEDASCEACQKIINEEFEGAALGRIFQQIRTHAGLKKSYGTLPIALVDPLTGEPNPKFGWEQLDLADHPFIAIYPIFARPGVLMGNKKTENFTAVRMSMYAAPNALNQTRPLFTQGKIVTQLFNPTIICRMLAKIAHGLAVAELGKDAFTPILPDIILGKSDIVSHYIGGGNARRYFGQGKLHAARLRLHNNWVIADIKILSKYGGPCYEVVVGEASPELSKWSIGDEINL